MANIQLNIKANKQEGDLANEYHALFNQVDENNQIVEFRTKELDIDLNNPLNIECQPSYDGTVNLILNDDKNPPRIINTRFTKIEDNRYKVINRNQLEQTNLYKKGKIDRQTRLFRNINKIPRIDLNDVSNYGKLKGGNYTFYIKFADNDYNKTDIVCESGQVAIFKGYLDKVTSVSGTLLNELTDKAITLKISNIDTSFSKFYLYFVRETSDTNGIRLTKAGMFTKPYDIKNDVETITLNGYEEITDISVEELNIKYNLVTAAKTQAQVQNMLFLGNVQGVTYNIKDLQNIAYYIKVALKQESNIGWVSPDDYSVSSANNYQTEYYSPNNIYYKLGYWPNEIYRLGVVFVMNDDSLSSVFNLRGCEFSAINDDNFTDRDDTELKGDYFGYYKENKFYSDKGCTKALTLEADKVYKDLSTLKYYKYTNNALSLIDASEVKMNYLTRDDFLNKGKFLDNTFGVFKNPDAAIFDYTNSKVQPLYYELSISNEIQELLKEYKVKGYFFVRQERIPTTLGQGFSVGIDRSSYVPMLYDGEKYFSESFVSNGSRLLTQTYEDRIVKTPYIQCSGLLSLDACVNPTLQSNYDGSEFILHPRTNKVGTLTKSKRHYALKESGTLTKESANTSLIFVGSDSPMKYINGYSYSTKCGTQEDVSQFSFFSQPDYSASANNLIRGLYCPFLGANRTLQNNTIYDIRIPNYSITRLKDYFSIRGKDNSSFYAISDRYELGNTNTIQVFRGDCYTNTVTIRLNRNFIDSDVPINELIVSPSTWKDNYKGYNKMTSGEATDSTGSYASINRADVNSVNLGHWVTFKCLSNYNLGLRAEDISHTDERALMGNSRSFYPLSDMNATVSSKIEESWLLNQGYNVTLGQKRNFVADNVPYVKELFDNRIMFSDVQQEDEFKNSYRIFQGLDYKDIDRQYGAIVKFLPLNGNIFCVFEHGLGIIPINEKALIQTSTSQSIHMYGAGVVQNQITLISPDFGSIWPESVVRTPNGIYGVDTYAKKIWRYGSSGLETISDMKIQQYLNNKIQLSEMDKSPIVALRNVKSHYNNYKGDIMFTFYNKDKESWNICFNERMNKWITRYTWTPLYSENINNIFYSLDQKRAKLLSIIYNNRNTTLGVYTPVNEWSIPANMDSTLSMPINLKGYDHIDDYTIEIMSVETSFKEAGIVTETTLKSSLFTVEGKTIKATYSTILEAFMKEFKDADHFPLWFKFNLKITLKIGSGTSSFTESVGLILNNQKLANKEELERVFLQNGFYVHGRAGIFDEINYDNESLDDQILPTKWYEKQEPFELEFVVNDPIGMHKIFDNLVIISNNVQPNEIEYEIIGDVFNFNKAGIFASKTFEPNMFEDFTVDEKGLTTYPSITEKEWKYAKEIDYTPRIQASTYNPTETEKKTTKVTQRFKNCSIKWDTTLNTYSLVLNQPCKNIYNFGRRLGNIQYKEDAWYVTIDPILFRETYKNVEGRWSDLKSAKVRDKYVKIRVKYTGTEQVIITALKTLLTISYS